MIALSLRVTMNTSLRAYQRLAAVAVVAVLACILACRPAWSPDGERLLFTAVDNGGRFVACYDRETGMAERVLVPPAGHDSLNAMWGGDGKCAVVLSGGNRGNPADLGVTEVLLPEVWLPGVVPKTLRTMWVGNAPESKALVGAVVVARHLFFSTGDIVRLDLDTGVTESLAARRGERLALMRRGDGLCYVSYVVGRKPGPNGVWEVGSLDPETLQRTRILQSKDFPGVQIWPRPAFSSDLERIAMPSQNCESLIMFREGKIESTLPLGAKHHVHVNDLVWSRHGDKIYATLSRLAEQPASGYQWSLYEATIGGSMQRETVLFGSEAVRMIGTPDHSLGLAISPDGKTAAMTTAYVSNVAKDHGLYLVDLSHARRTVTKVAFPKSQAVTMRGSDYMRDLAMQWSGQFRVDHPGHVIEVIGGGTGPGFAALLAGDADFSMATRPASAGELDQAKQKGITLEQHCVVRNVAAICVHKDSPIKSLTIAQLAKIFGVDGVTKWSELGFEVPESDDDIIMATRKVRAASYDALRSSALALGQFAHSRINPENDDALIAFAAIKKGAIVAVDDSDAAVRNDDVKVIPIARDDTSRPCMPTEAAIVDGSYPLVLPMFVYSRKGAGAKVSRFLEWVRSDVGKKLTTEFGFRPAK
ncbi:MAG: phosphate transport system substrate-binding protein [Planctomycetota bacterium]|jgi:phosphate transport system substrate-binding protein